MEKQYLMLKLVLQYYDLSMEVLNQGADLNSLISLPVREAIARAKYLSNENFKSEINKISQRLTQEVADLKRKSEG